MVNQTNNSKSIIHNSHSDPLHGVTLKMIVTYLVERYGWEELGRMVEIRCFTHDPSIASSLKFLRKTAWARDKVEALYLRSKIFEHAEARECSDE
jgi:uncharacterized protein (DUF2132 family)